MPHPLQVSPIVSNHWPLWAPSNADVSNSVCHCTPNAVVVLHLRHMGSICINKLELQKTTYKLHVSNADQVLAVNAAVPPTFMKV